MRKTAIEAGKYSWRVVRNRKDSALIAVIAALISSVLVSPSFAQFSVPTSHGDNTRTGANTNETLLKPDSIDKNNFGRLLPHDRSPMPAAMPAGDVIINATAGSGSAQFNETVQ